jgi:hypothetical protein
MRDTQSFQRPVQVATATGASGGAVQGDYTLDHHSVAIPIAVGADYRITKFLSLGPAFEYTLTSAVAGCAKVAAGGFSPVSYCSNEAPGSTFVKAKGYGVWSAGLEAKLTF